MTIKASELQEGQRIHIEYGVPDNWVTPMIEEIHRMQDMIIVVFHFGTIKSDAAFRPGEEVEVLQEDAGHA